MYAASAGFASQSPNEPYSAIGTAVVNGRPAEKISGQHCGNAAKGRDRKAALTILDLDHTDRPASAVGVLLSTAHRFRH